MSPIQQMLLGVGAKKTSVFVDDIFSTYLWAGSGSARSINNGIDQSGEGSLTWIKSRTSSEDNLLFDTERGAGEFISSNENLGDQTNQTFLSAFNNNGFSLGNANDVNGSGQDYSSWTFRKSPAFTIKQYSGTGSNQSISHDLGSIPGMILVKCTTASQDWAVYHRSTKATHFLELNESYAAVDSSSRWNDTDPTSTHFTVGTSGSVNDTNATYIAYIFAGGESTAATARSVVFDNDADRINIGDAANKSSDLNFGSSDFTWECWIKADATQGSYPRIIHNNTSNTAWGSNASMIIWDHSSQSNRISFYVFNQDSSGSNPLVKSAVKGWNGDGQWHHVAVTRSGNIFRLFSDGTLEDTLTWTGSLDNADAYMGIGQRPDSTSAGESFKGSISNVRIVKGTAVYTSSFKPSTVPLTNITNTKLLCCNNSSVTGSTVTPLTIFSNGSPTASSDSPFDDPAGFVFGENEDQNVIKCGSYVGNGSSSAGAEINLGFEPQWILLKCSSDSENWRIYDSMRGIVTGGTEPYLRSDREWAETSGQEGIEVTSTGFKLVSTDGALNQDGRDYIYCCIRRPDGYVGKPPELGSDCFQMATAASAVPRYSSGFPVDLAFKRRPATTESWYTGARLIGKNRGYTDATTAFSDNNGFVWDSNTHWPGGSGDDPNDYQAWMWKRHAGFDVVVYKGRGASSAPRSIPHSLSKPPEMIWTKNRDSNVDWVVWHKDLNGGGNNAVSYNLRLNDIDQETSNGDIYGGANGTLPTTTHWTTGGNNMINENGSDFISLLFASVDGISRCGGYSGSNSAVTVDCGFVPRLVIQKKRDQGPSGGPNGWLIFDTVRGIKDAQTQTCYMFLSSDAADVCAYNVLELVDTPSVKGFSVPTMGSNNNNGSTYVYYAHS